MVYRPTVRYADEFKKYVDDLYHATDLDRNQIIRAALFSAAVSPSFEAIMKQHKKKEVSFPPPPWSIDHHWLWLELNPSKKKRGQDVNIKIHREEVIERVNKSVEGLPKYQEEQSEKYEQPNERREERVPSERIFFRNQGGISIKIG